MSIYPTRTAAHVAVAGLVVLAVGIALGEVAVVAWGGAMLAALALARTVALVSVMRIRAAGFEMLWSTPERVVRLRRGQRVEIDAEVRNRDTLAARYDRLRVVASPALDVEVHPRAGEVPGSSSLHVRVALRAKRVGYHGVFGLALEVRGAPGMFEIPLTFANPYGVEVLPRALSRVLALPQGGRSGTIAAAGRAGRRRGDGTELRELREHQPGDPFRRIAWKASARRGKLVVREFEREERDVVFLVLDASVELWAGPVGLAPLDHAIDMVAAVAARHLSNGDRVGLVVVGGRELGWVAADTGRGQARRIAAALVESTSVLDADRCGWDEADLLLQVAEHLRPLDPRVSADLRQGQVDRLVKRAAAMRAHAPFDRPSPYGRSARDRRLRRYAACFGLSVPPRVQPDHPRSAVALAEALTKLARSTKPRASLIHVVAPVPGEDEIDGLATAVGRLRRARAAVRWSPPPQRDLTATEEVELGGGAPLGPVVEQAVLTRALVVQRRGEASLGKMGVRIVRLARPSPWLAHGGDGATGSAGARSAQRARPGAGGRASQAPEAAG